MDWIVGDSTLDELELVVGDGAPFVQIALKQEVEHGVRMGLFEKCFDRAEVQVREKAGIGLLRPSEEAILRKEPAKGVPEHCQNRELLEIAPVLGLEEQDRKSTRLNSSHL